MATHNVEWGLGWGESVSRCSAGGASPTKPLEISLDEAEFRKAYGELGR